MLTDLDLLAMLAGAVTDDPSGYLREYPAPETEAAALAGWVARQAVSAAEIEELICVTPKQQAILWELAGDDPYLRQGVKRALAFRAQVWAAYQAQQRKVA